jgi:hypothetical protein
MPSKLKRLHPSLGTGKAKEKLQHVFAMINQPAETFKIAFYSIVRVKLTVQD